MKLAMRPLRFMHGWPSIVIVRRFRGVVRCYKFDGSERVMVTVFPDRETPVSLETTVSEVNSYLQLALQAEGMPFTLTRTFGLSE